MASVVRSQPPLQCHSPNRRTCIQRHSGRKPNRKARGLPDTMSNVSEPIEKSIAGCQHLPSQRPIDRDNEVYATKTTQKALVVPRKLEYELIDTHPFPALNSEKEVIIRNYAIGLNPIDWKSVDYHFCLPSFPWVTGREMAGVVEKVGSAVTTCQVGDRVWTSTYYRDSRAGCFQEFVTVPQHTVLPIPDNLGYETAACLGVAALTAAMTLWKWLCAPANLITYGLNWVGSALCKSISWSGVVQQSLASMQFNSPKHAAYL